ncbi:MAG TPA: hypothetical protein VGL94_03310 [Ktedonobacteraceae bacterium]|jgi:hypothetical protein
MTSQGSKSPEKIFQQKDGHEKPTAHQKPSSTLTPEQLYYDPQLHNPDISSKGPLNKQEMRIALSEMAAKAIFEAGKEKDISEKKPSPLDNIKELKELLKYIPSKYHDVVNKAYTRGNNAETKKTEKKEPRELASFVDAYYNVDTNKKGESVTFEFRSRVKKPQQNHMEMNIDRENGILSSGRVYRENKAIPVYLSDIQRYARIDKDNDYNEIPINEYHYNFIDNNNTKNIIKALYHAHNAYGNQGANDMTSPITFTRESAAFKSFLGAEINLSIIYLARDLGRRIESVTIQYNRTGKRFQAQWKFVPND